MQPYTGLLYEHLAARGVSVAPFSIRSLMFHRPDIVHFHWPENRRGGILRALALLVSLRAARLRGTRVVLTVHNASPHESWRGWRLRQRWYLTAFDRQVDMVLTLALAAQKEVLDSRPNLADALWYHTRHGELSPAYPPAVERSEARAVLGLPDDSRPVVLFIGQIRPYKNVAALIDATLGTGVQTVIAGRCLDPDLTASLHRAAADRPDVVLRLTALDEREISLHLSAADLVVLPYRRVLNSGAAILALGFGRPVLLPETPTFRELQADVGEEWVRTYADPLSPTDIAEATADPPRGSPDLEAYEWPAVTTATLQAYATVADLSPRRVPNES